MAVVLVMVVAVPYWFSEDIRAKRAAVARAFREQAEAVRLSDVGLAARLAVAAYRSDRGTASMRTLSSVMAAAQHVTHVVRPPGPRIVSLARDPRRDLLYAATSTGDVVTFDGRSMRARHRVRIGLASPVLATDPTRERIAVAGGTGEVQVWRTAPDGTLTAPRRYRGPVPATVHGRASAVGFAAGGRLVYGVWPDGRLRVWTVGTGGPPLDCDVLGRSTGARSGRSLVAATQVIDPRFGSRSDLFAVTDRQAVLRVDVERGVTRVARPASPGRARITSVAIVPRSDGRLVYLGRPRMVEAWNRDTGRVTPIVRNLRHPPLVMRPAPDGRRLMLGTVRGAVLVDLGEYRTDGPENVTSEQVGSRPVADVVPPGDDRSEFGTVDDRGEVSEVDPLVRRGSLGEVGASTVLAFDGPGALLLSDDVVDNHTSRLFTIDPRAELSGSRRHLQTFGPARSWWSRGSAYYVNDATIDDRYVLAGGQSPRRQGVVAVWDRTSARPLRLLRPEDTDLVTAVRHDPQLGLVLARTLDGRLVAWSTADWTQVFELGTGVRGGRLDLTENGRTAVLALAYGDPERGRGTTWLTTIDLRSHRLHRTRNMVPERLFLPGLDERSVVGVTADGRIGVHPGPRTAAGRRLVDLPYGPSDAALGGDLLAVSHGTDVHVLSATTGGSVFTVSTPADGTEILTLALERGGTVLAAETARSAGDHATADGTWLWDTDPVHWVEGLCAMTGRGLSPVEWAAAGGATAPFERTCAR